MAKSKPKKNVKATVKGRKAASPPRTMSSAAAPATPERVSDHSEAIIPGPSPPRRREGAPPVRVTTHKQRAEWFNERASWPFREASAQQVAQERTRVRKALAVAPGTANWVEAGPSNIGGRLTSVVCDPKSPDHIWVGSAGGGVWRSRDQGKRWEPLWHTEDVLNIGSLAIQADNPKILYCGTGEANLSADSYPGVGVYKTEDGGDHWWLLASSEHAKIPRRIGTIAIDPFDANHLILGGVGHLPDQSDLGGLYSSRDGGVTWTRSDFVSPRHYWCHAVVFHPKVEGIVFATVTEQGANNGIWRSDDGGNNWTHLTNGLPPSPRIGRTSLAIAPSSPDVLYALSRDEQPGSYDAVLGVFRSADRGDTWTTISGDHFADERQMSYNNTIAVHPEDPDHVICGGVDLHLTTNKGSSWSRATDCMLERDKPGYAHADHHALLMPAKMPGLVLDANDGGLDVSKNGGTRWTNRSDGLAVTMFYDADVAQSDGLIFGGGAQDNGTVVAESGKADDFFEILGGDGGWLVFDPADADHLYASYQNMNIFRWLSGQSPEPAPLPLDPGEGERIWMAYIAMDPKDPKVVFVGSTRVFKTTNDSSTWRAVSPSLDGSPITAIEVARADPKRIYVGTECGGFFRSVDGGASWSANLASATLPKYTITRIASVPQNADRVFVTVANIGHSHVFESTDGGLRWSDADRGQLPNVPHQAIVIPQDEPDTIYVGDDVGVYASKNLGLTWINFSGNLPNVMVTDLVYHLKDGTLTAATYGRSLWKIKVR